MNERSSDLSVLLSQSISLIIGAVEWTEWALQWALAE